jgi:hypothetical protein
MDLRRCIAEARRLDAPVRKSGLQVRHRDMLQAVSLEVVPIKGRATGEGCLLVLFEPEAPPVATELRTAAASTCKPW